MASPSLMLSSERASSVFPAAARAMPRFVRTLVSPGASFSASGARVRRRPTAPGDNSYSRRRSRPSDPWARVSSPSGNGAPTGGTGQGGPAPRRSGNAPGPRQTRSDRHVPAPRRLSRRPDIPAGPDPGSPGPRRPCRSRYGPGISAGLSPTCGTWCSRRPFGSRGGGRRRRWQPETEDGEEAGAEALGCRGARTQPQASNAQARPAPRRTVRMAPRSSRAPDCGGRIADSEWRIPDSEFRIFSPSFS